MERTSSTAIINGGTGLARSISRTVGLRFGQFSGWLRDKGHQFLLLPGNEELIRAVLSAEKTPMEGARYRIGERIDLHQPDGSCRRLKIYGIQCGGFSNVYTVVDLDEMRPYCLKENRATPGDENAKNKRLAAEAYISLKLTNVPNLVTTYSVCRYRGRLMILTEYLSGASLDQRLKAGVLPLESALSFGVQLAAAMRRARGILPGFVHGDVKPGNCLIASTGQLQLGDFGLACADGIAEEHDRTGGGPAEGTNRSGGWGGTTAYKAPEMFGEGRIDRVRSDIYAFGVTVFEMLAGRRPFAAPSQGAVIDMHRHAEPPLHLLAEAGVPGPAVALVQQCLAKSPADRPESFESIENELRRLMHDKFGRSIADETATPLSGPEVANVAFSYAALGDDDAAASCLDHLKSPPENAADLLAWRAIASLIGSRVEHAYAASTAALMKDATSFLVLFAHGRTLAARGDLENAELYGLRALGLRPDNISALNFMGGICLRTEQYDEAASYFERSCKLDAAQAEAWEGLGTANLSLGYRDRAIGELKRATELDPLRAASHCRLGEGLMKCGDTVGAIRSYKAALSLPGGRDARKGFVRACAELHSRTGRRVNGRLARILMRSAGWFSELRGRDDAARLAAELTACLRENGFRPLLVFFTDGAVMRIFDHLDTERWGTLLGTMRASADRADADEMPAHVLESFGRVFYHIDEYEDCRNIFLTSLRRWGPDERAHYYLAACSEVEGDYHSALDHYSRALNLEDCEDTRTGIHRVAAKIDQTEGPGPGRTFSS